jgi:hypothetical protein
LILAANTQRQQGLSLTAVLCLRLLSCQFFKYGNYVFGLLRFKRRKKFCPAGLTPAAANLISIAN